MISQYSDTTQRISLLNLSRQSSSNTLSKGYLRELRRHKLVRGACANYRESMGVEVVTQANLLDYCIKRVDMDFFELTS